MNRNHLRHTSINNYEQIKTTQTRNVHIETLNNESISYANILSTFLTTLCNIDNAFESNIN